jgi:hypothetical protein
MTTQDHIVTKEIMMQDIKARNLDKYVDMRLNIWADWARRDHHMLGYPQSTIEWRLINEGGVLIKGTGPKYPPSNFMAEEVEFHIIQLKAYKSICATAIRDKYLADANILAETLAKRSNISVRTFDSRVKEGKIWLAGRLSAKNDEKYFKSHIVSAAGW